MRMFALSEYESGGILGLSGIELINIDYDWFLRILLFCLQTFLAKHFRESLAHIRAGARGVFERTV